MASLGDTSRAALLSTSTRREFPAGSRLITEGDLSRDSYLIHEGVLKVTADTPEGRTALLAVRVAGDVVGEIAGLDGGPRMASVTTAGLVRVSVIGHRTLHWVTTHHPEIGRLLTVAVAAKLRWSTRRRLDSGARPVDVRVARVLVDLAHDYGRNSGDSVVLGFGLSQPELAALIGASEPAVHRAVTALRRRGIVTTAYRRITIHDMTALRDTTEPFGPIRRENLGNLIMR